MPDCHLCEAIAGKVKGWKVYEDEKVCCFLSESPASAGHVIILPREHYAILESVPDYVVSHAFNVANKISTAMFEALGAQGTNIIVNNGPSAGQEFAHFMIHVIARRQNDGISFQWQPKQLSEEEMSAVELAIKSEAKEIGNFETEKPKPIELDRKPAFISESQKGKSPEKAGQKNDENHEGKNDGENDSSKEENYLIRHLTRIP